MSTALPQRETRTCMPSLYQLVSCSRSHALCSRWRKAVDVEGDYVKK
jgi:hypothetical protein